LYKPEIEGVLFGGPGPAKEDFLRGDFIPNEVKNKVIGSQGTSYADESGLYELLERGKHFIAEADIAKERELVKRFLEVLQKDSGLVVYGVKEVVKALERGAVETVLLSEDVELIQVELECKSGHEDRRIIKLDQKDGQKCEECGQSMGLLGERELLDLLEELTDASSANLEIISKETREGVQLAALGGIGAMLRYKI